MNDNQHVLIVDDDRDIRDGLKRYLGQHGYRISTADSAESARRTVRASFVDLVVLDIMMPGEGGLSLCRFLREYTDTPVILLTALADETDRIVGLEVGADDYVVKPFNPRELLARIKAVLRRFESLPPRRRTPGPQRFAFDRWVLDAGRRELIGEGNVVISLSTGEFRLLTALIDRPHMVLSREQLLDITHGREADSFDRSIDNQISRLRRKIERDPKTPRIIQTIRGGGYAFAEDVKQL